MTEDDIFKGFATQGFSIMMTMDCLADQIVADGGEVTGESPGRGLRRHPGHARVRLHAAVVRHRTGTLRRSLQLAGQPDPVGWLDSQVLIEQGISGIDLVAGTELQPGPS